MKKILIFSIISVLSGSSFAQEEKMVKVWYGCRDKGLFKQFYNKGVSKSFPKGEVIVCSSAAFGSNPAGSCPKVCIKGANKSKIAAREGGELVI